MFVIRQANLDDAPTLLKLAKMVHFINLPADPDIISSKITRSRRSFTGRSEERIDREFLFVLEDASTGNVIGTSAIVASVGTEDRPHTYLQVRKRKHYSEDLQEGHVHVTLQLKTDTTGPSEIGGLILSPSYRGHAEKLGSWLSLVRFHYIGLQPDCFSDRLIAEMMGPLTPDSQNLLWDYLGRRFINLGFADADRFCQQSKEFITSLFPKGEVYATLLPPEARNLIGKVGEETKPAKRMLERLGFQYKNHVDPFDGGPYLEAQTKDISLITSTTSLMLGNPVKDYPLNGFVSVAGAKGFRAIRCRYALAGNSISIPADEAGVLGAQPGDEVGLTPLPEVDHSSAGQASNNGSRSTAKSKKRSKRSKSGAAR